MYTNVRENRTSLMRKLGRPVPHAMEHVRRGRTFICPSPSNEQSLSPRIGIGSQPDLKNPKQRQGPKKDPESCTAREFWFAAELASLNFTIDELKTKLLASEQLVSEQALQLSECSSAQTDKDAEVKLLKTQYSKLCQRLEDASRGLDKATTKVQKHMEKTTFFENELMIARQLFESAKVEERQSHAEAELQEQLLSYQKFQALYSQRIQNLEKDLKQAHETILNQQNQLDGAHAEIGEKAAQMEMHSQAEAQLRQQEVRMQQELERNRNVQAMQSDATKSLEKELQHARETINSQQRQHEKALAQINELREEVKAEAQLRQDGERMQDQLQSTQELLARRSETVKILEEELKAVREGFIFLQKQQEALPDIKALQLLVAKMEMDAQAETQLRHENNATMEIMRAQLQSNQQLLSVQSEKIHRLETNEQDLSEKLIKKDVLFIQVSHKLAARKEEYRNLFEIVKEKETKVMSREYSLKLLEEQSCRSSLVRAVLEKKNAALEEEIVRLKHDLRQYSGEHEVRNAIA